MISGPTLPDPRRVLASLLSDSDGHGVPESSGALVEAGLTLVERDLEVGGLCVDFLARDASGLPLLLLVVDADDEDTAPMRILDLVLWFRQNAFLFERALTGRDTATSLAWGRGFRTVVVTSGVTQRFLGRLRAMSDLNLEVLELTKLSLRGETHWFLQGVEPWVAANAAVDPLSAPSGLGDGYIAELCERLLQRIGNIAREVDVRGDRFRREVFFEGRRVLRLDAAGARLAVTVGGSEEVLDVQTPGDLDRVVDRFLRVVMEESEGPAQSEKTPPRAAGDWRSNPASSRVSEAEMAAFLKQETLNQ
jgi:hypothetical protein